MASCWQTMTLIAPLGQMVKLSAVADAMAGN